MTFRLRVGTREYPLEEGAFHIGRNASSQLLLDDPLVSRNHAIVRVEGERVRLEDLASRNGVKVNGTRVDGERGLIHGDLIEIGSQQLMLIARRDSAQTLNQPVTERFQSFVLMGPLVDKALALGKGGEAEKLVQARLEGILEDAQNRRKLDAGLAEDACALALKLASGTGNGRWVTYVVSLYRSLGTVCPAQVVDQLYDAVHRARQIDPSAIEDYVASLREVEAELGPNERFLLGRLEGLGRVAASR